MKIQGLKGTRDFFPDLMLELNYIFNAWREVSLKYGYQEFDGPLLEPIELWTLKSGNEIPEQMYRFKDKSDSEIAVRPELTPTLARMIAAKQKELVKPIKWFSIGRFWRYEAPQSGRLREFFQYNVDCLGTDSMKADAEVISMAISVMLKFGCTKDDFYIRISNRKLANCLISSFSKSEELPKLIDKSGKLSKEDFNKSLEELDLDKNKITQLNNLLSIETLSNFDESNLDETGKKGLNELNELFELLDSYGFSDYVKFDLSIMRGMDYYTSTVFEIFDSKKELRAIAGGGRYDDLVKEFGGEPCSGIGFGMGDVVLSLFLKKLNKMPGMQSNMDYFIAPVTADVYPKAVEIASVLRKKYNVGIDVSGKSLSKLMDYANTMKAKNMIIVGKKDLEKDEVTLKLMDSGSESKIELSELERL